MNKPNRLKHGDKVAIVSLSSGILGESFIKFELELGVKRLKEFGLEPIFMPNSLKGLKYIAEHPEARANDLKDAFLNPEIKAIICAIGGVDTFKTYPYLLEDKEFIDAVKNNPKIFMGFSDTTANHIMFQKLGLNTFYGPALLPDFAELANDMLPYTKNAIDYLFNPTENYKIKSSDVWYQERTSFKEEDVGTDKISHTETRGYEVLKGTNTVTGKLIGGCIDVLAHLADVYSEDVVEITNELINSQKEINKKYNMFPSNKEWNDSIIFFETSEEKMPPEHLRKILQKFKTLGVFDNAKGLIFGKPTDEVYYEEYKHVIIEELKEHNLVIMYNFNFGHSTPRTIIPYGTIAELNPTNKTLTILENPLN